MYFVIVYWLFRGKVAQPADGYGHWNRAECDVL